MEQRNIKIFSDLLKRPGNGQCADCGSKEIEYASYNLGIFLCPRCTQLHNQMGSHVSKTKHLKLDHWEDSQIDRMKQVGNLVAKAKYEARVPVGFRRPVGLLQSSGSSSSSSGYGGGGGVLPPDPQILLEHWIQSKYTREEFIGDSDQSTSSSSSSPPLRPYLLGIMDSFLMKKGREDPRYFPRRFVLDPTTLRYFVKEKSHPKAVLRLVDLDVSLNPAKCGKASCLQLSYLKDGSTRHLYVCHDDSELVMQWYHALRIGKLAALKQKCSEVNVYVAERVLLSFLPQDSLMEGYLWKAGPSPSYAHRRRWFTLSPHRKLMYHIDALDAYPKGEIFLGTSSTDVDNRTIDQTVSIASKIFDIEIKHNPAGNLTGFKVSVGGFGDDKMDAQQRWVFSLHTPYRTFILAAETQVERDKWVGILEYVLRQNQRGGSDFAGLSPRDVATCALLVRKRNGSTLANISVSNPLSGLLSSSSSSSSASASTPSVVNTSCNSGSFNSSSSVR